MREKIVVAGQYIVAGFVAHYTGIPAALKTLAGAMLVDIITGMMAARYQGIQIKSRALTNGALHKAAILLLCFLGHPFETFLSDSLGVSIELNIERWIPIVFIFGEILSIMENLVRCDVQLPGFLVMLLIKGKSAVPSPATEAQLDELFGHVKVETTHTETNTAPDGAVQVVKDKTVVTTPVPAPVETAKL